MFGGAKAVRSGNWKGIRSGGKLRLYDLGNDISESNDLAAEKPEIAKRLQGYIEAAYDERRSQKDDGKYTGKEPRKKQG